MLNWQETPLQVAEQLGQSEVVEYLNTLEARKARSAASKLAALASLFLVAVPGAPSSVLVTSSKAPCYY